MYVNEIRCITTTSPADPGDRARLLAALTTPSPGILHVSELDDGADVIHAAAFAVGDADGSWRATVRHVDEAIRRSGVAPTWQRELPPDPPLLSLPRA